MKEGNASEIFLLLDLNWTGQADRETDRKSMRYDSQGLECKSRSSDGVTEESQESSRMCTRGRGVK
ncbi:hypothetical protein TESG_04548 [Trichophyton tonsurans CBS 112818]|uniref:Uncharacterized protein n=2 Tax=Trichophyton TaxID=5550 RepID=F2PJB0_TRIEC|nr:hypothetical protein TESG_04548 [Trichophyton tonsurans CBS 112818]EGE01977.1 hypothetical protein TEQG_08595 [Trichophyton equinum CBS 127.97]